MDRSKYYQMHYLHLYLIKPNKLNETKTNVQQKSIELNLNNTKFENVCKHNDQNVKTL